MHRVFDIKEAKKKNYHAERFIQFKVSGNVFGLLTSGYVMVSETILEPILSEIRGEIYHLEKEKVNLEIEIRTGKQKLNQKIKKLRSELSIKLRSLSREEDSKKATKERKKLNKDLVNEIRNAEDEYKKELKENKRKFHKVEKELEELTEDLESFKDKKLRLGFE